MHCLGCFPSSRTQNGAVVEAIASLLMIEIDDVWSMFVSWLFTRTSWISQVRWCAKASGWPWTIPLVFSICTEHFLFGRISISWILIQRSHCCVLKLTSMELNQIIENLGCRQIMRSKWPSCILYHLFAFFQKRQSNILQVRPQNQLLPIINFIFSLSTHSPCACAVHGKSIYIFACFLLVQSI